MERKEFLRTLGAGAAFALTFPCLQGCSKDDENGDKVETPTGIDFTIDLNSTEGQALAENGSFILKELVVVVKDLDGNFVAATQICSHESYDQVRYLTNDGGIFYCDVHGSRFALDGEPLNQVDSTTAKPLKIYNTELNGDILRVYE
ncbi:ubiquinol-cytochrome c reductase iron-sulfur subunit [Maribacter luteus]|uniref:Rieske 2Fe-2S domain-containing protein n=1 Tax=Maribacter luteus TaxID=2594478 RepID=A0A6I2MUD0_9FLAO|nr:Rieske 2Fe-2S domain-containing protein [Maribacter luteus]MRX65106.1 Rieske 2Fe-2S domain-containing protein [Maribacter luteus]|tara:strand:- start:197 stop:637 length:441 start_codon:yes stop_codon:yes gene_type:complete